MIRPFIVKVSVLGYFPYCRMEVSISLIGIQLMYKLDVEVQDNN